MISVTNPEVFGWKAAIRGMRNPMNSWDKSDSFEDQGDFIIGPNIQVSEMLDTVINRTLASEKSFHEYGVPYVKSGVFFCKPTL